MSKKIVVAVICGIIIFGLVLTVVGVLLGGTVGSFYFENQQIMYNANGVSLNLKDTSPLVNRLVQFPWLGRWAKSRQNEWAQNSAGQVQEVAIPFETGQLEKLSIDIGAGNVIVKNGANFGFAVDGPLEYSSTFANGHWEINADLDGPVEESGGRFWLDEKDITTTFIFTIPGKTPKLDLEIGLGNASVSDLSFNFLECTSKMGSTVLNNIATNSAQLTAEMGSIAATSFVCKDLALKSEMGSINIHGSVSGKFAANCGMGKIFANLTRPNSFGWTAKVDMGKINIDGNEISGMQDEKTGGEKSAENYFDLECGMGEISISFDYLPETPTVPEVPKI